MKRARLLTALTLPLLLAAVMFIPNAIATAVATSDTTPPRLVSAKFLTPGPLASGATVQVEWTVEEDRDLHEVSFYFATPSNELIHATWMSGTNTATRNGTTWSGVATAVVDTKTWPVGTYTPYSVGLNDANPNQGGITYFTSIPATSPGNFIVSGTNPDITAPELINARTLTTGPLKDGDTVKVQWTVREARNLTAVAIYYYNPSGDVAPIRWDAATGAPATKNGDLWTGTATAVVDGDTWLTGQYEPSSVGVRDDVATWPDTDFVDIPMTPPSNFTVGDLTEQTGDTRLAGDSRYTSAVAVSQKYGTAGNPIVLATGQSYADALAAGPVAARLGASLLLTPTDTLLPAVSDEITRLGPSKIIIVGSTTAVSSAVASEAKAAAGGIPIERVGGNSRVETAAMLASKYFPDAPHALVATGWNFPDALSASTVGAVTGSPVLLTTSDTLQPESRDWLAARPWTEVSLVGSEGALSPNVFNEVQSAAYGTATKRYAGADRYATNVALMRAFFDSSTVDTTIHATGQNFPDALVASVIARAENGPLVLTPGTCATAATSSYLTEVNAPRSVTVGSETSVSPTWRTTPCPA